MLVTSTDNSQQQAPASPEQTGDLQGGAPGQAPDAPAPWGCRTVKLPQPQVPRLGPPPESAAP
ncbi:hypothetical protein [Kamptonema formosum]|uniref:hypothetical protein n=1 Tax=Kamptonema formosum TaxID=331992 RepID=UPI000346E3E7|nr:hypothetical protein [Oscillatoria sp. PCC 10802]